jgi:hypothetical protein
MLAAFHSPGIAGAQEATPRVWQGSAGASASVFFGNTEQRVFGGRVRLSHADSALELGIDVEALYGDASVGDQPREVIKRVWLGTITADGRPHARLSPFVFGTLESNFEKRIARRYSAGAGAKRTFIHTGRQEASLSAAVLAERTVPRDSTLDIGTELLTRWSWRGRLRYAFDERLHFSHVTFWQPALTEIERFLLRSASELRYQLGWGVALTFSFLDSYDSEARRRGARHYNDGQLLFGAAASW